jgi:hypothetical protein
MAEAYAEAAAQLKAPEDSDSSIKIALLVFHVDHNIDPLDESIESIVLKYLSSMEDPEIAIECHMFTS